MALSCRFLSGTYNFIIFVFSAIFIGIEFAFETKIDAYCDYGSKGFVLYYNVFNSLAPGRCGSNYISVIPEHLLQVNIMSICEIGLKWMPLNAFDDTSALVQVMA